MHKWEKDIANGTPIEKIKRYWRAPLLKGIGFKSTIGKCHRPRGPCYPLPPSTLLPIEAQQQHQFPNKLHCVPYPQQGKAPAANDQKDSYPQPT